MDEEKYVIGERNISSQSTVILKALQNEGLNEEDLNTAGRTLSKALADPFEKYTDGQVIEPFYPPHVLAHLFQTSPTLAACTQAMVTNIDSFGHVFDDIVKNKEDRHKLKDEIEDEKERLKNFFKHVNPKMNFVKIRKKLRMDLELTGNAYLEILRMEGSDEIAGFEWLPSVTMRLGKSDKHHTITTIKKRIAKKGVYEFEEEKMPVRFRKFIQISPITQQRIWFNEYGDKRLMDCSTGERKSETDERTGKKEFINDDRSITNEQMGFNRATEVIHFKINDPVNDYGIPRWMAALFSVLGERDADSINKSFFDRGALWDYFITVSGGKLSDKSVELMGKLIEGSKGKEKAHSVVILHVDQQGKGKAISPLGNVEAGRSKVEVHPVNKHDDMMFGKYKKSAKDDIRRDFRLAPIYIGDIEEYTKASAFASKSVTEEQVFQPEREDFDFEMNSKIMPILNARFHDFKTKGPLMSRAEEMEVILKSFGKDYLTGREGRKLLAQNVSIELDDVDSNENVDQTWLNIPPGPLVHFIQLAMTLKQNPGSFPEDDIPGGQLQPENEPEGEDMNKTIRRGYNRVVQLMKAIDNFNSWEELSKQVRKEIDGNKEVDDDSENSGT